MLLVTHRAVRLLREISHTSSHALSYSIVIEGERGNRQRIYSLEQLLQEAVSMPA